MDMHVIAPADEQDVKHARMDTGESMTGLSNHNNQAFDKVLDMQVQLETEMQQM